MPSNENPISVGQPINCRRQTSFLWCRILVASLIGIVTTWVSPAEAQPHWVAEFIYPQASDITHASGITQPSEITQTSDITHASGSI